MRIDIVTIFPKMVRGPLEEGIVGRAITAGVIDVRIHDLREYAADRHRVVDPLFAEWIANLREASGDEPLDAA